MIRKKLKGFTETYTVIVFSKEKPLQAFENMSVEPALNGYISTVIVEGVHAKERAQEIERRLKEEKNDEGRERVS